MESEIKPQPVEDLFRNSSNDTLRNIALNILADKKDAQDRLWHGAIKLALLLPVWGPVGSRTFESIDVITGVLSTAIFVGGVVDLVKSFHSRGEANAFSTVLAAEAIAQSKQPLTP